MPKVVYLFGAGASCGCLPVVSEIPLRLEDLSIFITDNYTLAETNDAEIRQEILTDLKNLIEKIRIHASVDTYAKKLLITGNDKKLRSLKALLSFSFIYDQLTTPLCKYV